MNAFAMNLAAAGAVLSISLAAGAVAQTGTGAARPELSGMSQAIRAAANSVQGHAFEVELETEDGRPVYEVEVLDERERIFEIVVDAETGEVLSEDEQVLSELRHRFLSSDELSTVTGAGRTLADIVESVQRETSATAVEADIDSEDGRVIYEMELTGADGEEIEVEVDATTGEIVKRETDD